MELITRDILLPNIKFYERSSNSATSEAKTKKDFENNITLWKTIFRITNSYQPPIDQATPN